jgi:RND family efflux transporter MFP subunit
MTGASPFVVSRGAAAAVLLLVLAAGAGGTWIVMRNRAVPASQKPSGAGATAAVPTRPDAPPAARDGGGLPDIVVPLTTAAVERAGIVVAAVGAQPMTEELRLPGVIEPNAYRQVVVTPLVGGRVVRVSAQLGDRVRRGQPIAQVYSPELADARTKYVAARSMLDAHDRELQRTQKLVEIGAASRQELERIHAEHAAQTADVESARSRLELLGVAVDAAATGPADRIATIDVPAPIDGIVTERQANAGLNVDSATKLFTVVDLASVWVVANAYERDLPRIHAGARATVRAQAYPNLALEGRVSYIDPQLSVDTRTAKVRVEVANPRGELRLGMYADVVVAGTAGSAVPMIPKSALQNVGGHLVVYMPLPGDPAKFMEREVHVGRPAGDLIEIVSGVKAGDSVVSQGSFYVKAEAERLGLRGSSGRGASTAPAAEPGVARPAEAQTAKIVLNEKGYEPATVRLRAGVPATLTFVRTTDKTCGTEVVFPSLGIKRALPLNEPVTIELTPKAESIAFTCGMNMLSGIVVVQQ